MNTNKEILSDCFVDRLPSSRRKTLQLFEDTHSISCGLDHISLRQHALSKCLYRKHTFWGPLLREIKRQTKIEEEVVIEKKVANLSSPQQGLVVHRTGWVGRRIGPPWARPQCRRSGGTPEWLRSSPWRTGTRWTGGPRTLCCHLHQTITAALWWEREWETGKPDVSSSLFFSNL